MQFKRFFTRAVVLFAIVLVGGCGPMRPEEEVKDTLIFGFQDNFKTFDPAYAIYSQEGGIITQVLEPLVRWNFDLQLEPHLAEDYYTPDDCKTWVFNLRPGIQFHDGTPFNAEAVKTHFDRILDPATGARRRRNVDDVEKIVVLDDLTVEFHLAGPNCIFVEKLGQTFACIPSPTAMAADADAFASNPVGTGPFRFVSWDRETMIIRMKRNPDYWKPDAIRFEHLIFDQVVEHTTRFILLEQGMLDIATLSNAQVDVAKRIDDVNLDSKTQLSIRYIGFNNMKPPFDDARVRRAVNHAVNKHDIVEHVLFGVGTPAKGPLPEVLPAFNPDLPQYEYDPDKARALLKEAGYGDEPIEVVAWTYETGNYRKIMDATVQYMREVGFEVDLKIYDNAAYWDQFDRYQTRSAEWYPTDEGVFDMFVGGWVGGETAHGFLDPLFRGPTGSKMLSTSNSAYYDNPEVNKLLAEFKSLTSPEDRDEAFREMQRIIAEDAPWIFTFYGQLNTGVRDRVKNFEMHPAARYFFEGVELDDGDGDL